MERDEATCLNAARAVVRVKDGAFNHHLTSSQSLLMMYPVFGPSPEYSEALQSYVADCMSKYGYVRN